jgi:myosin-1
MYLVVSTLVGKVLQMKLERSVMLNAIKAVSISNLRDDWMVSTLEFCLDAVVETPWVSWLN